MKANRYIVSILVVFILSFSLPLISSGDKGHIDISAPSRATSFTNVSSSAGLEGVRGDNIAWGDYNNDDYLDLLIRGPSSNLLFRNNGPPSWDFTDVSEYTTVNTSRGYSKWADYNNDGYLDFFSAGTDDHLFRNNGPPSWDFIDVTASAGNPNDDIQSEGITWIDYDRDGFPDVFTVGWRKPGDLQWPYAGEPDRLYHNNGDGTFSDVSLQVGLRPRATSYAGMGAVACDPNMDGWPDIYVSNYHLNPNQLWINNRDGTFTDMAFEYNLTGKATEYEGNTYYGHCNGAGWADIDNDLDMDVFVSHLAHKDDERSGMNRGYYCADSQLFLNHGPPYLEFEDIREQAGIPITPSGTVVQDPDSGDFMWKDEDYFGVAWGDMDNDGDLDLWVPQVKTYSFWDHSFLWENDGDLTFTDSTDETGLKVWSNTGGTWVDYDNDGDLDFCTEGTYPFRGPREIHLFQNPGNSNHWVELDLKGAGGGSQSSTDATGAKVEIIAGEDKYMRYVGGDCGGHGFQQPQRLHIGLGSQTMIDEIWVYWPSGRIQKLQDISVDQILNVDEPQTEYVALNGPVYIELDEDEGYSVTVTSEGAAIDTHMWDTDLDGFDDGTNSASISFSSSVQGTEWVRYRAMDKNDVYWDLEPIVINISNVPPKINAQSHHQIFIDEAVFIDMNVSDSPSDIPTLMNYYMVSDIPDVWEEMTDGDIQSWPVSFSEIGEYEIHLRTVDDDGAEDTAVIDVEVLNRIPEVDLTGTEEAYENEMVTFKASAFDTEWEMEDLNYRFYTGDGTVSSWGSSDSFGYRYDKNGTYEVAVEVMDPYGDIGTDTFEIRILNDEPRIFIEIEKEYLLVDEETTIEAQARIFDTDNDMDGLEVLWDFDDGIEYRNWGRSTRITHTYSKSGTYDLKASVRDDDGAIDTDNVTIIVENVPPTITMSGPSEVNEDSSFSVSAVLDDTRSDREILQHKWDMGDGTVTEWRSGDPFIEHTYSLSESYKITLFVRDDDEIFEDHRWVDVLNVRPAIDLRASRTVEMDSEIRFDASRSTDTASDVEYLRFFWDLGDGHEFDDSSVITHVYREAGAYQVELKLMDDDEYPFATEQVLVTVTDPPPVADLSFNETVFTGDVVIFDFSGSYDTVTDQPNLTYKLDPGDGSGTIETAEDFAGHEYTRPGEYEVELTVSDGNTEVVETGTIYVYQKETEDETSQAVLIVVISSVVGILIIIMIGVLMLLMMGKKKEAPPPPPPPMMPPGAPRSMVQPPQQRQLSPPPPKQPQLGPGSPGYVPQQPPAGSNRPPPPPTPPV